VTHKPLVNCWAYRLAHAGGLAQLLKAEHQLSVWELKGLEDLFEAVVILQHSKRTPLIMKRLKAYWAKSQLLKRLKAYWAKAQLLKHLDAYWAKAQLS